MASIIHETASVADGAQIGEGTKIWHHSQVLVGAVIGRNCTIGHNCLIAGRARIGNNVKIQSNTDVWDMVTLEDDVFVGPSVVFTNDLNPRAAHPKDKADFVPTLVRRGVTIGANATIVCGITIGEYAFIGAGAVVTKDVPPYALFYGNPARQAGWMSDDGEQLHFDEHGLARTKSGVGYRLKNDFVTQI